MRLWFGLLAILLVAGGHPTVSSAHGKERHFGTKINERSSSSPSSTGAPAFAILSVRTNLSGLERALDDGRPDEVHQRTARLRRQVLDLIARTKPLQNKAIDEATRLIAERTASLDGLKPDREAFRAEIGRLREMLSDVEGLLPQDGR